MWKDIVSNYDYTLYFCFCRLKKKLTMAMTAAQLLDELMGRDRNLVPGEKSAQVHWSHPDVS